MERLILIAASGLAREALISVRAAGSYDVLGFLDDDTALRGTSIYGVPVLGPVQEAPRYDARLLVCVGSGRGREEIVNRLARLGITADRYARVADPTVRVPDTCTVGPGTILLAGVVLTASVVLGSHVVAMPRVVFTHDDIVQDYATFAAGVALGGSVQVGRGAYLGMNASVRQRLRIGSRATLGMGSALIKDLPPGQTWGGVPARPLYTAAELSAQILDVAERSALEAR
jgi:sugar O-acyltransferase (sialic acid O-acetyltransferase NeuD family)